jgi:hypothetical protein
MLYTIITDGKNSLFSTSYRPRGTLFKLVGISSKATNVTYNKKALVYLFFPKRNINNIYKTCLGQSPIVPAAPRVPPALS